VREIFVKVEILRSRSAAGCRHGYSEDGIGTQAGLGGRTVQFDHALVESALISGVKSHNGPSYFVVDVRYGLEDALTEIARFVAVAQLQRLVFSG
jgi:hypothetical protein